MDEKNENIDTANVMARLIELIGRMPEEERLDLLAEMEKKTRQDKRQAERKPVFMAVEYVTSDRLYKDFIRNLSSAGVFIETHAPQSIGDELSLTFPVPDSRQHLKVKGEIVWTCPQGIGVKFRFSDEAEKTGVRSKLRGL